MDRVNNMKEKRASFTRILRPYWKPVFLLSALTVIISLLQVGVAVLSRYVLDAALGTRGNFVFWASALVADILLLVAVNGILSWFTGSFSDRLVAKQRQKILKTAVHSRDEKLLDYHSGALLSRAMEDVHTICDGAVTVFPTMVGYITRLVAAFAAIVAISPGVALVMLIAGAAVALFTACLRPITRRRQRAVRETDETVMATMQEDLQQLELVQSLDAQEQVLQRFARRVAQNLKARFRRRAWGVSVNTVVSLATQAGSGGILLWGAIRIADGTLTYGSLTAMLELFSLFRMPVLGLTGLWSRFATMDVAAERLETLLEAPEKSETAAVSDVSAIVFENVTFAYPGDEMPVLENFCFRFPLEGWTCLTGVSGKGKTTVFKLILGLYTPQAGRIYLQTPDGEVPCTEATRHLFAYVPQDYALLSGTILENMQLVAPDVDARRLQQVLETAQADFVWELTDREQTQVRENNAGLSKGQLQRLAIARAILMDRPVLLLDECTSALDAGTEDALLHKLYALGKRAILVTHRPEALQDLPNIDRISMEE